MPSELENPLRWYFAGIVNEISLWSFYYFIKDNPFWKNHAKNWTWMYLNSFFWSDTNISSITLNLSNIQEICTKYGSKYGLMNISWWLYLIESFFLLLIFCKFKPHHFLLRFEPIEWFDLIFELMVDFDCMLHSVIANFHLLTWFFLFIMFGVNES